MGLHQKTAPYVMRKPLTTYSAFSIPLISTIIRGNREKGIRPHATGSPLRSESVGTAAASRPWSAVPTELRSQAPSVRFADALLRASPLPFRFATGCPNRFAHKRIVRKNGTPLRVVFYSLAQANQSNSTSKLVPFSAISSVESRRWLEIPSLLLTGLP